MGHSQNKHSLIEPLPLPEADHYVLAFSGGSDSTALLHYLVNDTHIKNKLSAIHVNHQVHPDARHWAKECQSSCQEFDVPCTIKAIKTAQTDENSLRINRYKAFSQHIESLSGRVILLTAHHLNDDVETLVFRLIRGTGLAGLTGMTDTGSYQGVQTFRPLINTPKTLIRQYLNEHSLSWIDDDSNLNTDYDRNYIRHKIIPRLEQLRPDAVERIKDSRDNLSASLDLLNQLIGHSNPLPLNPHLSVQQLATTLYHWLARRQLQRPHKEHLLSFCQACLDANADKLPQLKTDHLILTTWQQAIYALNPQLLTINTQQSHKLLIQSDTFHWHHELGHLSIRAKQVMDIELTVRFGTLGEKIQQVGRKHRNKVKEVLRQKSIPPWQRKRLPYVFHHNKLMAVGSIISHEWQQYLSNYEAEYDWQSTDFIL